MFLQMERIPVVPLSNLKLNKMKKRILLIASIMMLGFTNLNAGCDDGIWIYVCNSEEVDQLKEDANNNCCDGSIIYYVDVCRNFDGTHLVNGDGPNSSCSPT